MVLLRLPDRVRSAEVRARVGDDVEAASARAGRIGQIEAALHRIETLVFTRCSTVAGGAGSVDTPRDVRGFAVKFYNKEGD